MERAPEIMWAIAALIVAVGIVGLNTSLLPTSEAQPFGDWRFWAMVACWAWTFAGLLVMSRRARRR